MKLKLLEPFENKYLGQLNNRVVMSAMTRSFANNSHECTTQMAEYYERRAKNGIALMLTEGVIIHPTGDGYNNTPHIWSNTYVSSWKIATEKVHVFNTKIFCQLWHCGRISHEDFTGGVQPVSSTDKPAEGINRQNGKPYAKPRRLTKEEIPEIYDLFLNAGENAIKAGFDGIELHFGHGYLVDEFFDARINDRMDEYGGSIENRCRFALELTDLMIKKFGSKKVIIRMSPSRDMGGIYDWPDLDKMLDYLIKEFNRLGVRMLDISCANANYFETSGRIIRLIRKMWQHLIMGGASLSIEEAEKEIQSGYLDMATWGRMLIANPDFLTKLKHSIPLTEFNRDMLEYLY